MPSRYSLFFLLLSSIVLMSPTQAKPPEVPPLSSVLLQLDPMLSDPWVNESAITPYLRSLIREFQQAERREELAQLLSHVAGRFGEIFIADLDEQDPQSAEYFIDLAGIDLSQTKVAYLRLYSANLVGIDLQGATLEQVELRKSDLTDCNLRDSRLNGVILAGSDLSGCDLTGAKLIDADLYEVKLDGATWLDGRHCAAGSTGSCKAAER